MLLCATIETFVDAIPLLTELLSHVLSTVFREISLIMTTEDSAGNTDRPATMESDSRQSETISGTGRVAYTHRYTQVHTGTHRCTQVTPSGPQSQHICDNNRRWATARLYKTSKSGRDGCGN